MYREIETDFDEPNINLFFAGHDFDEKNLCREISRGLINIQSTNGTQRYYKKRSSPGVKLQNQ